MASVKLAIFSTGRRVRRCGTDTFPRIHNSSRAVAGAPFARAGDSRGSNPEELPMADGGNGGPLANLEGYLKELDVQFDELDSLRGSYMAQCKGPRGQIKEILASAKEAGINMK